MKNRLSLVLSVALLGSVSAFAADSLQDALKGGKVSGDVAVTYESRDLKKDVDTYYQDTAYSVGSIGLNYETGSFYGFSANVGMRAYANIWQDNNKLQTWKGSGDASERFWEDGMSNKRMDLANAYLAYTLKDVMVVKVGRQVLATEWMTKYHDAVSAYITPFERAQIEAIYSYKRYRVDAREHFNYGELNGNDGIYKLGFTYEIFNGVKAKVYGMTAPDLFDAYGAKVSADLKAGDFGYGGFIHYAKSSEDRAGDEDGKIWEGATYLSYAGYKGTLGYSKTGKKNGIGSLNKAGEQVDQFEEGDYVLVQNARTTYFQLSKTFFDISLTAMYGQTKFDEGSVKNLKQKEFDLWASYNFTKNLGAALGYTITEGEKSQALKDQNLKQLNATLTYKF